VHEFFGRDWIEKADGHEYPFLKATFDPLFRGIY